MKTRYVIWAEVNDPVTQEKLDQLTAWMSRLSFFTPYVELLVSSTPSEIVNRFYARLYERAAKVAPGLVIHSGIKTNPLFGQNRIGEKSAWDYFAKALYWLQFDTQHKSLCIIDCESMSNSNSSIPDNLLELMWPSIDIARPTIDLVWYPFSISLANYRIRLIQACRDLVDRLLISNWKDTALHRQAAEMGIPPRRIHPLCWTNADWKRDQHIDWLWTMAAQRPGGKIIFDQPGWANMDLLINLLETNRDDLPGRIHGQS